MKPFTIVLPVRDTEQEYEFLKKSLPSAIKLNPDEIIIGVDKPLSSKLYKRIIDLTANIFSNWRIIEVERSPEWKFQLAKVVWECYTQAKHDTILSFDVDSVLRKEVLLGLDDIGADHVAVLSFTKKIRIKNIRELIRYIFYRIRVMQNDYVFSGVYWVNRPYFFDTIPKEKYMKIINGVDTILCNEVLEQKKYKIITRKEIGISALDIQNEDLEWRQFQTGIWIGANSIVPIHRTKRKLNWNKITPKKMVIYIIKVLTLRFIEWALQKPNAFIHIKAFIYGHPYLVKGYYWAIENKDSESVKMAKSMNYNDWGFTGSTYLPKINWKRKGTGF